MGARRRIFGCLNASSPKYTLYRPRTTAWTGVWAVSMRLTAVSAAETEAPTVITFCSSVSLAGSTPEIKRTYLVLILVRPAVVLCMFNATGIACGKLLQARNRRNKRNSIVTRGCDNGIEYLSPPIVRWLPVMHLCAAKSKSPLLTRSVLNSPFNSGVVLNEATIALSSKQILDVLPDDRVMAERSIFSMALNRPLRTNGRYRLLGIAHCAGIHIGFQPRVNG